MVIFIPQFAPTEVRAKRFVVTEGLYSVIGGILSLLVTVTGSNIKI